MNKYVSIVLYFLMFCSCKIDNKEVPKEKTDDTNKESQVKNKQVSENYYYVSKDSSNILLDCHEVDSVFHINDRCLLIDYLITKKWGTVFCLNKIITTFQVETGIKSRARFSDLNGYFYHSEKVMLEDLKKYKNAYKCH